MIQRERSDTSDDRLIFLAEAPYVGGRAVRR